MSPTYEVRTSGSSRLPCCLVGLVAALGVLTLAWMPVCAATYYVDNTNCPGPGDGSSGNPFCKIKDAIDTYGGAGTTIIVRLGTGDYYEVPAIDIPFIKSGSSMNPFVIRAASPPPNLRGSVSSGTWTDLGGGLWRSDAANSPKVTQVIMDDGIRYRDCDGGCTETNVPPGNSYHDQVNGKLYIKCLTGMPCTYSDDNADLCVRVPITVRASYVTIDGFSIINSSGSGILVQGSDADTTRGVLITNCSVGLCRKRGIEVQKSTDVTISNNECSYNTDDGIQLASAGVRACKVVGNTSYWNVDYGHPTYPRGATQGIQIGNSSTATDGLHLVERNKASFNQDSGFELLGSNYGLLRYNQSWENGDHGFDHKKASHTFLVGNLAYGNEHTGISVESDAPNTTVKNCVMADNGRALTEKNYELEVLTSSAYSTYVGDHNVIYRPSRSGTCPDGGGPGNDGEEADSILISLKNTDNAADNPSGCNPICTDAAKCFGTVLRYATNTTVNPSGNELHSRAGDPQFYDAANGNFLLGSGSSAVDAADTTAFGWLPTDINGLARHNNHQVANVGSPSGTFADIGPNEFDDGAPTISVSFGYDQLSVSWTARGEEGDVGKPSKHEIFVNGVLMHTNTSPPDPGTAMCVEVGPFASCSPTTLNVEVKTTDSNSYPYGYPATSNVVSGTTACVVGGGLCETYFGGGGGGEFKARPVGGDYPLGLGRPEPNPSRGASVLKWSIPMAHEGAPYELAVFDVAGRRVATIARGAAKAGSFVREATFRDDRGGTIADGVYFIRFRIASQVLWRTVILAR